MEYHVQRCKSQQKIDVDYLASSKESGGQCKKNRKESWRIGFQWELHRLNRQKKLAREVEEDEKGSKSKTGKG